MKTLTKVVSLIFIAGIFNIKAHSAESDTSNWQSPSPVFKQKFDWLRLSSDEWLKGEIISMYNDELEFDSDELDVQTIDLSDVSELRSKDKLSLRFSDGTIAEGQLVLIDKKITLVNGGTPQVFRVKDLVSIALSGENEIDLWDGYLNLGTNFTRGNTRQFDYNTKAGVQRRSSTSRFKADFYANYSESEIKDENNNASDVVTANNKRLESIYDWFFSQKIFLRALDFEYFSDEFINIDNRFSYGVALGYHLIDTGKTSWDITAGPSYQSIQYLNVQEGDSDSETSGAISLSTDFEYEISKDIDFDASYQLQIVSEAAGDLIHQFRSGIEIDIAGDFDLDLTFYLDRIETPKADEFGEFPEQNDYRLTISLGYDF